MGKDKLFRVGTWNVHSWNTILPLIFIFVTFFYLFLILILFLSYAWIVFFFECSFSYAIFIAIKILLAGKANNKNSYRPVRQKCTTLFSSRATVPLRTANRLMCTPYLTLYTGYLDSCGGMIHLAPSEFRLSDETLRQGRSALESRTSPAAADGYKLLSTLLYIRAL